MALNDRQQARLTYLLRIRPNDPQVAQLRALAGQAQPAQPLPQNTTSVNTQAQGDLTYRTSTPPTSQAPIASTPTQSSLGGTAAPTGTSRPLIGDPGTGVTAAPRTAAATISDPVSATPQGLFTAKQEARLKYLLKYRPNDPQVKALKQAKAAAQAAGGAGIQAPPHVDPGDQGLGDSAKSVDDFIGGVFSDPTLGDVDLSGAPKILSSDDLRTQRTDVYNASLSDATKNLDRDKQRDIDRQEEELTKRGIPYTPGNASTAYGRPLQAINDEYAKYRQDAENNAQLTADSRLTTLVQANTAAQDAFIQQATTKLNAKLSAAAAASNALQVLMQKYGLSRQEAQARIDREQARKLAELQAKNNIDVATIGANARRSGGSATPAVDDTADEIRG